MGSPGRLRAAGFDEAGIRAFSISLLWAMRLAWHISRGAMLLLLGTMIVRGVLPATLALTARALVDALAPSPGRGATLWQDVAPLIGLASATLFIEGAVGAGQGYVRRCLVEDLNLHLNVLVTETAAGLPAEKLEQIVLQDLSMRTLFKSISSVASIPSELFLSCTNLVQAVTLVVVLAWIEPLVLLAVPVVILLLASHRWRLALRSYRVEYARTDQRRWQRYYLLLLLDYQHAFEVKLLGLTDHLLDRFRSLLYLFRDQERVLQTTALRGTIAVGLALALASFGLLARVVQRVLAGLLTVGDLVAFTGVLGRLSTNIQIIAAAAGALREQTLYVGDVRKLLAMRASPSNSALVPPLDTPAAITLEQVSFRYPDTERAVLTDVSLRIEPGQTVAIVGENGAGKSTLVKLIAGLYQPTAGRILYGEHELRAIPFDLWCRQISFVFQQFNRYETTVAENIAFGNWRRWLADLPAVERFARAAGIHTTIQAMPAGYRTPLGRFFGTYNPSDGQWQRIAVARAFAREDSQIIILDEPTASVDAKAEYALFQTLRDVARGRTTILISHRFANVRLVDRIFVLDGGRVTEAGTHEALLARQGTYAALYQMQAERFQERMT